MKTAINYTDTITAYIPYKESIKNLLGRKWLKDRHEDKKDTLESWHYYTNHVFLRYYPNLYGNSLLYISFSLPKVYYDINDNCKHVENFDSNILDSRLKDILAPHVDMNQLPLSFLDWQVSRLDLFYTHEVPTPSKKEHLQAYRLLYLPRHKRYQYKNTTYIMSNLKKNRSGSVVVRIYDKDVEMYEREIFTKYNTLFYPDGVHRDIEEAIEVVDDGCLSYYRDGCPYSRIRIELQLRRRKLLRTLNSKSVEVRDVFNESVQKSIINKYFISLGLNRQILSSYNFRKHIDTKKFKANKRSNIINCAKLLRKKRSPYSTSTSLNSSSPCNAPAPLNSSNVSRQTFNSYVRELSADNIHILTSPKIDLIPIKLL